MEPTNVARIKRHFVKRSFGNSIFPAHWKKKKKKKQQHRKISREEGKKKAGTETYLSARGLVGDKNGKISWHQHCKGP